jgi:EmrB/QacA subfamily drug resistance transporter
MAVNNPETTHATRPHLGWVLGLTSTAYFMVILDSVVVITALPRMQRDLHVGLGSLQWTLNSFNIAFAAGIITAAALGDRFGRRRVFNLGLALFTIASVACALAPNASELIAARTVQGLGGAIILPLSLTILTTAFPAERRGMIIGIYGGLAGLAVAMGPIIGGAVTQGIDWHWIFWINVPIGAVALPLALRLLPESHGAPERLDPLGVALISGGVVAIVWALVRANQSGWASAEIVGCLVAGAVLLLAFVAWERRVSEPLVPLRLFRSQAFALGNATTFLMTGAIFTAGLLVTEEFQFARGYSPVWAGVRLLPFFGTPMVIAPIAGAVSDRIGRRPVMATGLFMLTAGLVWVSVRGSLSTNWVELVIALLIAGVGISMALPTVPTAVLNAVAPTNSAKRPESTT